MGTVLDPPPLHAKQTKATQAEMPKRTVGRPSINPIVSHVSRTPVASVPPRPATHMMSCTGGVCNHRYGPPTDIWPWPPSDPKGARLRPASPSRAATSTCSWSCATTRGPWRTIRRGRGVRRASRPDGAPRRAIRHPRVHCGLGPQARAVRADDVGIPLTKGRRIERVGRLLRSLTNVGCPGCR
jgi:hypothetical protein